jgi:hypothetical protein
MRNLTPSVIALAVALVACGPSGQEVAKAKTARYQGDKLVLFNTAKAAVESKHKLAKADENALGFQTVGRWYTQDGILAPGSDQDMGQVPDKSIRMTLVVRLLPDGDNWIVQVEPSMLRRVAGSPKPEVLAPTDASVPGWATGQVDTLHFEVHKALAQYEVRSPGGVLPAAPAAPAPGDPAVPAPADGSAAPAPAP